ncbi:MAG: hypothetical protein HQ567_07940 [Candidatus Nealsonbacteria bacterium]|nr:hypothetical protein [Candidatus Nealsonbacteria bacterium]
MSHPLEQRLARLRRRVRRLVAVHGVCWVIAGVVAAVIVLGSADYLIRFQDRGIRVICSLLAAGALGWTCYRFLYLPTFARLSDVDLALRLQWRFPALGDRLVSSVEFLKQSEDDPVAGSAALRRAVIAQTTAESDRLDFTAAIDRRQPARAAMIGVAVCLLAAILLALDWGSSAAAVTRLVNPFDDEPFPQKTYLKFQPRIVRIGRGQTFEAKVVDALGAKLPRKVSIHYRFQSPDGEVTEETELMRPVDGAMVNGAMVNGAMVARRENVVRPFSYWATGGDDRFMREIAVEVLDPPEIKSLHVGLLPPKYTGWPREKSDRHIHALAGTRLTFKAETTMPLRTATLCLDGRRKIPGKVSEDGYHFTVPAPGEPPVVLERSGSYWFELTDRRRLHGNEIRFNLSAVPDAPPTITVERPGETLFVTSRAVVPLRVSAKDDLAVRDVWLMFGLAENGGGSGELGEGSGELEKPDVSEPEEVASTRADDESIRLYEGPAKPPLKRSARPETAVSDGDESGDRVICETNWDLSPLELSPGDQLVFHVATSDHLGQTGTSEPRRLIVITPDELRERIAGRQSRILAELARVLKMQRQCRDRVGALEIRLAEVAQFDSLQVDHLQAAEMHQRQITRSLTDPGEGVPKHVTALLDELDNNRIDSADVRRRMEGLLAEIRRLDREHLTAAGRNLTAAVKAARVRLADNATTGQSAAPVANPLGSAGRHQDAVIAALEQLLGELAQWDNYRRFHREIGQLLRDQRKLAEQAAELSRRTLTRELKDVEPQDRADLKILAGRQLELARQLDRIQGEMDRAVGQLQTADPLAAETVADALAEARRLAIALAMRTCGSHLGQNRMGQTTAAQKQIIEDLQEVLDILANRRQNELARLVKKLEEAETELADLHRRQEGLRKKIQATGTQADSPERRRELQRLAKQQQQLQQEADRLARRLQRLQAQQPAGSTGEAAAEMGQAGQSAAAGDQPEADDRAQRALKKLQRARRELATRLQQARADLALEQLARLEDALKHLRQQQLGAIDDTIRYGGLQQQGRLTRGQETGLLNLARLQRALHGDTLEMAEAMIASGAFHLALQGAGRDMGRAAGLLDRSNTGQPTQQAQQHAVRRLDMLLEALQPEQPSDDNAGADGGAGDPGGAPGAGARAVQTLAELKLLKLLQEEVNLRTVQLEEAVDRAGDPTDAQRTEYNALGEEQAKLADLVLKMLQPVADDTEEDLP